MSERGIEYTPPTFPVREIGRSYHLAVKPGDVSKYVLLTGDPERVPKIASFWDEAREIAYHREYRTFTGKYKGAYISACSTGIGGPAAEIALNELASIGSDTFIRVGSTGAIQREIECGDLVISSASVRLDATSHSYIQPEYPASANYMVLLALIEAAEKLGCRYHIGVTASAASFYVGQGRPTFGDFWQDWMDNIIPNLQKARVLSFDMETAAIFTLCNLHGLNAGSICATYANRATNVFEPGAGEEDCIKVSNEAMRILSKWDEDKEEERKRYWFPSLSYEKK